MANDDGKLPRAARRSSAWRAGLRSGAAAAALLIAPGALALPTVGDTAKDARVVDADDRVTRVHSLRGKPVLIVYEDKDSSHLNNELKADLARLAKGGKYQSSIALLPVADVSAYDFWPVKGFVKDAIRDESKKVGATIYCDWNGAFRKTYGLPEGTSSIVLLGRDGKVLFAGQGALPSASRREVLRLLRAQVGE
jgi:hypothetical protein